MTTYIVTVSWSANTELLVQLLGSLGSFVHLFDNTFLLNSSLRSVVIRDYIVSNYGSFDYSIYVSRLSRGSAWNNLSASNLAIKSLYSDGEE